MENELFLVEEQSIDSMELLTRYTDSCKESAQTSEFQSTIITSLDIVTAAYYYRLHSNVDEFIQRFLSENKDYMLLQWVRSTWAKFSEMTEESLSDLIIENIVKVTIAEVQ